MLPPVSRDGKFFGKFGVIKFPVFQEIYVGIPGHFFYISKDFRGTAIYHSDIKMRWYKFFFSKFAKF